MTAENFAVAPPLRHIYLHLLENRMIQGITNYNPELLRIRAHDVLARIQRGDASWEKDVPPPIAAAIKRGKLFGYTEAK